MLGTRTLQFETYRAFQPLSNRHREPVYRPLQFHKSSQLFIGANDETFSVTMRVCNPDRSPVGITIAETSPNS